MKMKTRETLIKDINYSLNTLPDDSVFLAEKILNSISFFYFLKDDYEKELKPLLDGISDEGINRLMKHALKEISKKMHRANIVPLCRIAGLAHEDVKGLFEKWGVETELDTPATILPFPERRAKP